MDDRVHVKYAGKDGKVQTHNSCVYSGCRCVGFTKLKATSRMAMYLSIRSRTRN